MACARTAIVQAVDRIVAKGQEIAAGRVQAADTDIAFDGSLAQGIGQALLEHGVDDPDSGQLLTGSYMDHAMPRADDLCTFVVETAKGTPCTHNPLGVKGCGEAGAIGSPPAVINAICHALGVRAVPMPATPSTVWQAARGAH